MNESGAVQRWKRAVTHRIGKRFLRIVNSFQARHSLVATTAVLPNSTFPWIPALTQATSAIREEFDSVWSHPEEIPSFHEISPDQARISKGNNWKTYGLYVFGQPVTRNCAECPRTAAHLAAITDLLNAWFSILAPGYHIPPHRGPTKALVRVHLGLKVPQERERCWIRVGENICSWAEGECLVFDDTYEHEVRNDTAEYRCVLFLDINRPMDRIGSRFNGAILRLMQASHYVKDPLKNLTDWNRRLSERT